MKRLAILCGLIMLIPLLLLTAGIGCDISSRDLRAVWGSSSSDVFAVDWHGAILHYDGNKWSQMNIPHPDRDLQYGFWGVWGSSSSDVFAVGRYTVAAEGDKLISEGAILHYDGNKWSQMNIPHPDRDNPYSFQGVWGSSSSDVFAVDGGGAILHYNGNKWSQMDIPHPGRGWCPLENVWGSSSSDVFAVGWYNHILHYDGNKWSQMKIPLSLRRLCPW